LKKLDVWSKPLSETKVAIFGMGYVGLTFALALIQYGARVLGVDKNISVVNSLSDCKTDILEPGIETKLKKAMLEGALKVVDQIDSVLASDIDVYVVTVGTPLREQRIDQNAVREVISSISDIMKENSAIILRSTLEVGTTRNLARPLLQNSGKQYFLAMCPERTIEGNAINEISSLPQIVGGVDELSSKLVGQFFSLFCSEVVLFDNPESAEIIKLANNTYRDLMFGFANELSELCGALGLDSRHIIAGANYKYPRSNIAQPGPSGGPCLTKDPWILYESGKKLDVDFQIAKAARRTNENYVSKFLKKNLVQSIQNIKKVSCLGLSFKGSPETRDIRGSAILDLLDFFEDNKGVTIYGFEPAGRVELVGLKQSESIDECLIDSDLVVILNNSKFFEDIEAKIIQLTSTNAIVLDFWGTVKRDALRIHRDLRIW
jgi:UDP-N-acetyl-D-mannosaminuronic acid dehydrogenase